MQAMSGFVSPRTKPLAGSFCRPAPPQACIHSHLTEEEKGINGSDHCLFNELLLQTNKTKRLPLVMHFGYLRHQMPKLNQRELRALMPLINQK